MHCWPEGPVGHFLPFWCVQTVSQCRHHWSSHRWRAHTFHPARSPEWRAKRACGLQELEQASCLTQLDLNTMTYKLDFWDFASSFDCKPTGFQYPPPPPKARSITPCHSKFTSFCCARAAFTTSMLVGGLSDAQRVNVPSTNYGLSVGGGARQPGELDTQQAGVGKGLQLRASWAGANKWMSGNVARSFAVTKKASWLG